MSERSKSVATVGIVALVLGASLVGAGVVLGDVGAGGGTSQVAPQGESTSEHTITVTASGRAEAEPDRAVVRVSVESSADDPTVARQRVAENASAMRSALVDLGLPADAVRTVGFDIYEDRVRPREGEEAPRTTYRARHVFAIEVDDTGTTGTVIDTAIDNGATSVHGVEFTLAEETRRELRRDAIDEAMADARDQAEAIAAGGGLSVTGVRSARTGASHGPRPVPVLAGADGGAGGGTGIESGAVSVTATATVTYDATR